VKRLCVAWMVGILVIQLMSCVGFNPTGHPVAIPTPTTPISPTTPTTPPIPVSPGCIAGAIIDSTNSTAIPQHVRVTLEAAYVENNINKFDIIGYPLVPLADGTFNLCYPAGSTSAGRYMVVVTASTDTGLQFAPVIIPSVQPNTSVGTITLGGGTAPQSDASARIEFTITSTPVSVNGAVYLDGISPDPLVNGGTMHYALPIESSTDGRLLFTTVSAGTCTSSFCAQSSIPAPSLAPILKNSTGYSEAAATATYKIRAGTFSGTAFPISATCNWVETSVGTNGLPLIASPGAILTASALSFTGC
jgi:hypothetical protein